MQLITVVVIAHCVVFLWVSRTVLCVDGGRVIHTSYSHSSDPSRYKQTSLLPCRRLDKFVLIRAYARKLPYTTNKSRYVGEGAMRLIMTEQNQRTQRSLRADDWLALCTYISSADWSMEHVKFEHESCNRITRNSHSRRWTGLGDGTGLLRSFFWSWMWRGVPNCKIWSQTVGSTHIYGS